MKILITSETFLPRIGGGEVHVLYLMNRLRALGHEVFFLTNQPPSSGLSGARKNFSEPAGVTRVIWSKRNIPVIFWRLWRESKNADVIHAHYSYRLLYYNVDNLSRKTMHMPPAALPYILFQRTEICRKRLLFLSRLARRFPLLCRPLVYCKAILCAEEIRNAFAADMQSEYETIQPFLPITAGKSSFEKFLAMPRSCLRPPKWFGSPR